MLKLNSTLRITPAPAGKTFFGLFQISMFKDHPRTCGENMMLKLEKQAYSGSPPHLRGKPVVEKQNLGKQRITPAPAGKTDGDFQNENSIEDHPRTCGENCNKNWGQKSHIGSPPHLRGKHVYFLSFFAKWRITPAPAGKTKWCPLFIAFNKDHPRTCGENNQIRIG